ncbi:MAG: peptide deformylase [Pseudomonadota bacterium]
MAKRTILIHPDPRLKKVCDPVEQIDEAVRTLVEDMFETMYEAPGIGLAAPQVGVMSRVLVMDCGVRTREPEGEEADPDLAPPPEPDPIAMINPEILWRSEETRVYSEGCLSIPEQYEDVTRPAEVQVRYLDREGVEQERRFDGLAATCVQHEIDHLNGKLFLDYLGPVKRSMITAKMKKLKRERAKERAKV